MEQQVKSGQALNDFAHAHKLVDKYSNIHFSAIVTINTAVSENKVTNSEMTVRISFDDANSHGKLYLEGGLDPYKYPTELKADYDVIEHIENEYLQISGHHTKNPKIGRYTIKIIPLS